MAHRTDWTEQDKRLRNLFTFDEDTTTVATELLTDLASVWAEPANPYRADFASARFDRDFGDEDANVIKYISHEIDGLSGHNHYKSTMDAFNALFD